MPLVTVVIATFNYGRFLGECLASVLAQTHADLEVIVVDDASTDDTREVVRALDDGRISYTRQAHRGGQAAARNRAFAVAAGAFVAFLDADDAWLPTKLERQLQLFARAPEVGLVFTNLLVVDAGGRPLHAHFERHRWVPHSGWVLADLVRGNFIPTSSVIVRSPVLAAVGGHEESLEVAEDWDLWLRIAARHPVGYVDEPLARYRRHAENTHQQRAALRDTFRVLERFPLVAAAWDTLPPGTRGEAYARAHSRAAATLASRHEGAAALGHLARAMRCDWRSMGRHDLRVAVKSALALS